MHTLSQKNQDSGVSTLSRSGGYFGKAPDSRIGFELVTFSTSVLDYVVSSFLSGLENCGSQSTKKKKELWFKKHEKYRNATNQFEGAR